jgi:hypothetical protein
MLHVACRIALLVLVAAVIGCGNGLVPIEATVTVDGKPCEGASVILYPEDGKGRFPAGSTDEDGTVRFTTSKPFDGVPPGTYKVCITKSIRVDVSYAEFRKMQKTKAKGKAGSASSSNAGPDDGQPPASDSEEDPEQRHQELIAASTPTAGKIPVVKILLPPQYGLPKTTPLTCTVPPDGELVFAIETRRANRR